MPSKQINFNAHNKPEKEQESDTPLLIVSNSKKKNFEMQSILGSIGGGNYLEIPKNRRRKREQCY